LQRSGAAVTASIKVCFGIVSVIGGQDRRSCTGGEEMATTDTDTVTEAADDAQDAVQSRAAQAREVVGDAAERVPELIDSARAGAEKAAARLPEAAERARAGVEETTTRLQRYPDDTLRLVAAGSLGLAAGLYLAGAPRLFAIAAASPAAFIGAAIATRANQQTTGRRAAR
jgi:hypothetical protein